MKNTVFEGVLVVDFTQALAGPYCTMLLANNGARVIKIERPGSGDMLRGAAPFDKDGTSLFWASSNSNKESVAFDLRNPTDLETVRNIIKKADILVENFRPGVMEKLGLGYAEISKLNPALVYTSISGFGHSGPMAHDPGFDLVGQGYSGMMAVNGDINKDEGRVGFPIGDVSAGMWGYMATVTAYCARLRTGKGSYVDVSMLDGLFAMMPAEVVAYTKIGEIARPSGNDDPAATPFGVLKTKDGGVIVAVLGDKLWKIFCQVINKPELCTDDRFKSSELRIEHRDELRKIVRPLFQTKTTAEWRQLLTTAGVPNGIVNNVKQACELPQIKARNMLEPSGPYLVPGNPMKMSNGANGGAFTAPEKLGQSTQKIMSEFGGT